MRHKKIFLIAIIVSGAQIFSAEYDDEKTLMLEQYLTAKVDKFAEKGFPDRAELEERIMTLVKEGASVHVKNTYGTGTCALHFAAEAGSIDLCQFLISRNAQLDVVDLTGRTPLHFACRKGHKALVHWLLLALANIEAKNLDGYTPLMVAVINNQTSIIHELLDYGANVAEIDNFGATALNIAFSCRHENAILALLAFSENPMEKKFNFLEYARNVGDWHLPRVSGTFVETFFDRIYVFPEQYYLTILNSCSLLFAKLPKDLKFYILRWVLAPWTVEKR